MKEFGDDLRPLHFHQLGDKERGNLWFRIIFCLAVFQKMNVKLDIFLELLKY